MQPDFFMALGAGLLGGLGHCSGMCGPIVLTLGSAEGGRTLSQLLYNIGRTLTYTALGAIVGAAGSFASVVAPMEGAQYALLLGAGIVMLGLGLAIAVEFRSPLIVIEKHNAPVIGAARKLLSIKGPFKFLPLGLTLGLLPCGLSYSMLIASAGAGGTLEGARIMLGFGLGTVPAMFLIGTLGGKLGHMARGRLYRLGGALLALMGAVYVYRAWVYYGPV